MTVNPKAQVDHLESVLNQVADLRVYNGLPDVFEPPGVSIGLPRYDPAGAQMQTLCDVGDLWEHQLYLVVARYDGEAYSADLVGFLAEVVDVLEADDWIYIVDATPQTTETNGIVLPAYLIRARVYL